MQGFEVGELITVSKPYAYVLKNDFRGLRCDCCFKKLEGSKHCSRCSFVFYCNKSCQVKAWQDHKTECRLLKRARSKPRADVRLLALIILKYKKYGPDEPFEETHGRRVTFGTLMSHAEEIKNNPNFNTTIRVTMHAVRAFIGDHNMPPFEEFIEIYGKMAINLYGIGEAMVVLGVGLYLGASVFDHSCDPNAGYVSEGVDLWIRATQYINGRDISKVYVSYIDTLEQTMKRQDDLMSHYYFVCQCSHCTSPERDELMERANGQIASREMEQLRETVSLAEKLRKVEGGLHMFPLGVILSMSSMLYASCMERLKVLVRVRGIPDTHISKIKAFRMLYHFCRTNGESSEALVNGMKFLKACRLYLQPYSSEIGFTLLEVSRLQFSNGNYDAWLAQYEEAMEILKVTLGEEHSLYQKFWENHPFRRILFR